jgi:hypothetical protein
MGCWAVVWILYLIEASICGYPKPRRSLFNRPLSADN